MKSNRLGHRRACLLPSATTAATTRCRKCAAAAATFRKAICASTSGWARCQAVLDLKIHWPSGQMDKSIATAAVNKIVTIVEGKGEKA